MKENELLTEVVKEFYKAINKDCDIAEEVLNSDADFYDFVEDNIDLKDAMYNFFHKMLDDYIVFRFYDNPIPALQDSETYMQKFIENRKEQAKNFFNFGGFEEVE